MDDAISEFPDGYDTWWVRRRHPLRRPEAARGHCAYADVRDAHHGLRRLALRRGLETDAKIRAALRESLAKATVILISHRITTLMQADRILVLENGQVSDIGTHEELISRPGIYREIYDIQMSSDDRRLIEEGGEAHAGI